jgi:hypothetical protein
MRTYGPDDEPDDPKINWIEAGIFQTCRVQVLTRVLGGVSPLFLLWAIRGSKLVPDCYLISFCALMVLLPNLYLWLRIRVAKKHQVKRELAGVYCECSPEALRIFTK